MAINKITDEQLHKIRKKSAKALPDRPTREGYNAEQIKSHLADFVLDDVDSFKAEVDRIVDEANKELNDTNKKFEEKVNNTDFENRVDEIYTEMGNVSMGDGSTFNYARKLYEESANIFNPINIVNGTLSNGTSYMGASNRLVEIDYIPLKPNTTYSISMLGLDNVSVHLYDNSKVFVSQPGWKTSPYTFTTPSNVAYCRTCFRKSDDSNITKDDLNNIMLNKGQPLPYNPYNPNRHITNGEAEFLKEEYDKQSNFFNIEGKYFSTEANGSIISNKNVSQNINYSIIDKKKILINSYNETGYQWLATTVEGLEKNKEYYINYDNNNTAISIYGYKSLEVGAIGTEITGVKGKFNTGDYNYIVATMYPNNGGTYWGNIRITKNPNEEYQPYNSASHITNPQADLLKSEWDKGKNLVVVNDINTTNSGVTFKHDSATDIWVLNGTSNSTNVLTHFTNCCNFKIEANKQYCVELIPISGNYTTTGNVDFRYYPNTGEYTEPFLTAKFNEGFKIQTNAVGGTINSLYMYWEQLVTFNNFAFKINISTHGSIIHEKDIQPVKWWENPQPNIAFEGKEIRKSLENAKSMEIYVKYYGLAEHIAWQKFEVMRGTANISMGFLTLVEGSSIFNRSINIDWANGLLIFGEATENGTQNNNRMVPVLINVRY